MGGDGKVDAYIAYTAFDLRSRMTHTGSNAKVEFDYGPSRERIVRRDYTGTTAVSADRVTHFVGNAEIVRFGSGKVEVRRYVAGVIRVRTKESGSVWERRDFLFTDLLGSTHVITGDDGFALTTKSSALP